MMRGAFVCCNGLLAGDSRGMVRFAEAVAMANHRGTSSFKG
jgi:hypothetical protein